MNKNALTSARQSFNNFWQSPKIQRVTTGVGNIIKQAKNVVNPIVQSGKRVINPVIPTQVQTQIKKVSNVVPNYIQSVSNSVSNLKYDLPFYVANAKREIARRVLPHTNASTEFDYEPIQKREEVPFDFYPEPTQTSSAEMQEPLFLDYPQSTKMNAFKQAVIANAGFRKGAQKYLSNVPVFSIPNEPQRVLGIAESQSANPAIGVMEGLEQNTTNDIILHELLHTIQPDDLQARKDFLDAYNKIRSIRGIDLSYGGPQIGYPNWNEAFATLGAAAGTSSPYLPIVGGYYKNIFEPKYQKLSTERVKNYPGGFKQLLDEFEKFQKEQQKEKK